MNLRCMVTARWRHAAFVASDVVVLQILLGLAALIRFDDYAHSVRDDFAVLESAYPLGVWALGGYFVSAFILGGIVWSRHVVVWLGHGIGVGYYALIAVSQIQRVLDGWPPPGPVRQNVPLVASYIGLVGLAAVLLVGMWRTRAETRCAAHWAGGLGVGVITATILVAQAPLDGVRGVMPLVILAALHGLVMLRTGPRPLTPDHATPVEVTAGDDGAGDA